VHATPARSHDCDRDRARLIPFSSPTEPGARCSGRSRPSSWEPRHIDGVDPAGSPGALQVVRAPSERETIGAKDETRPGVYPAHKLHDVSAALRRIPASGHDGDGGHGWGRGKVKEEQSHDAEAARTSRDTSSSRRAAPTASWTRSSMLSTRAHTPDCAATAHHREHRRRRGSHQHGRAGESAC